MLITNTPAQTNNDEDLIFEGEGLHLPSKGGAGRKEGGKSAGLAPVAIIGDDDEGLPPALAAPRHKRQYDYYDTSTDDEELESSGEGSGEASSGEGEGRSGEASLGEGVGGGVLWCGGVGGT